MNTDLKRIKKKYGERVMHFCRSHFSSLLETPGLLPELFEKTFDPNPYLGKDMAEVSESSDFFVRVIMSQIEKKQDTIDGPYENPFELMRKAGYRLIECHTEQEIQAFKKYYAHGEELCTFKGGRLNHCFVFFAVRDDVDDIKREDFLNPAREDRYGTSVISIQFDRIDGLVSIKNRYNHTVDNPDATFSNNLDFIIPGLRDSFEKYIRDKYDSHFSMNLFDCSSLLYVKGNDGRYYRFFTYVDGVYYCENNIIIDNGKVITDYSGEKKPQYIFCSDINSNVCYIFDTHAKKVFTYDGKENEFTEKINSSGVIREIKVCEVADGYNELILVKYEDGREFLIPVSKYLHNIEYGNSTNYIMASDGKYYEVTCSVGDIYYNVYNNIIIDHKKVVTDYKFPIRYRLFSIGNGLVIIDRLEKRIFGYNGFTDPFIDDLNANEIEKISVDRDIGNRTLTYVIKYVNGQIIKLDVDNGTLINCNDNRSEIEGEKRI